LKGKYFPPLFSGIFLVLRNLRVIFFKVSAFFLGKLKIHFLRANNGADKVKMETGRVKVRAVRINVNTDGVKIKRVRTKVGAIKVNMKAVDFSEKFKNDYSTGF
jgi:hypothetical protein